MSVHNWTELENRTTGTGQRLQNQVDNQGAFLFLVQAVQDLAKRLKTAEDNITQLENDLSAANGKIAGLQGPAGNG